MLPSLHVLSRTRAYPVVRTAAAGLALAAATGWGLDRLGVLANPLAALAAGAWLAEATGAATARGRLLAGAYGASRSTTHPSGAEGSAR